MTVKLKIPKRLLYLCAKRIYKVKNGLQSIPFSENFLSFDKSPSFTLDLLIQKSS